MKGFRFKQNRETWLERKQVKGYGRSRSTSPKRKPQNVLSVENSEALLVSIAEILEDP